MNEISANVERLTQQLNAFKPVNEGDMENLKGEITADVSMRLSQTEQKVAKLSAQMTKQSEAARDTSSTLQDLLGSIRNLADNVSNIQKEVSYWRDSEVVEAEEELENL